uniref:Ricin B lectin domain-containing protein n=1 Tax=Percolomonas cosmopolitus TaxID=63605 RepID=A0A7S1PHN5_9EUKA
MYYQQTPQYRIQNTANGLFLDINYNGNPHQMPEGSNTPLCIRPQSNNWTQVWEVHHGQIRNATSGYNLHHGNQNPNSPFACMVRPTTERHQIWQFQGKAIISALDGKGLTVEGNHSGARVDVRPFNANSPPSDCCWTLVPINVQFKIRNKANGLVLDVNHSGPISNMQGGSNTPLFIQNWSGNWGQVWEVDQQGHIKNASSGFNLHHGNQNPSSPFACMVRPTDEKHQIWELRYNGAIVSALDGKGLTVSGNDKGSRVDVRPFNINSPPSDCQWRFVKL